MSVPSPLGRPARRGRRSPRKLALTALAALWLLGGLVAAVHYVDSYYQYRGFAPPADPKGVPPGRVLHETFFSAALGRTASYVVYLPPGYDAPAMIHRRFPAVYLLHGSPGYPEAFLKIAGLGVSLDVLLRQHKVAPMMLVMPDGRIGGDTFSESEWANGARGRYGDFVLDVVADVDRHLRTKPVRSARVLAGYSEGGFGAVNVGLHNLRRFAGIEAWSGYFVEGRSGTFATAPQTVVSANSPLEYATSLGRSVARYPLRVFLYTGKRDGQAVQMGPLVAELRATGARAESATYPGAHDWGLWHAHASQMISIADRDFALGPRLARPLSRRAALHALLVGRAVAERTRRLARVNATIHDRQVAACRASVAIVARGAGDELAQMSPHGRAVVHYHLVRNCLTAPPGTPVTVTLCARLPFTISIARRSALARRRSITARCLGMLAARPAHG